MGYFPSDMPPEGFLRVKQIIRLLGIGRSTWWEGVSKGRFPKGVKIGPRITVWKIEDIRNLMDGFSKTDKSQNSV